MSSTPSDARARILDLAQRGNPPAHSDTDHEQTAARRAWHGFRAISVGSPDDDGSPFDVGAVDAIANILHAVALDPAAPRDLNAVCDAALMHVREEIALAMPHAMAPNGAPWGDEPR